jgi:hypothetical protein
MRAAATLALFLGLALAGPAPAPAADAAAADAALYRCTVIVTGQGEESRATGFARCLGEVLAKVSGDARLAGDPKVAALGAAALAAGFSYRDRMEGIPVHDEQGSRDRPYDLTIDFDPAAIDAALRSLGRTPWTAPRPTLAVVVRVTIEDQEFALAGDSDRGRDMREALAAAAEKTGLPVVLPDTTALAEAGLDASMLTGRQGDPAAEPAADDATLGRIAAAAGADLALAGRLVWNDKALGWTAEWRLTAGGSAHRWQTSGVSFDATFRNGLSGAAAALSGNGAAGSE